MTVPSTLLTVMAHPDDAELWAGGTIARHIHDGGTATVAVATHDPIRLAEAKAGAQLLGAHLYLMDELSEPAVKTMLTEVRPDILITHSPIDIHPEHRRCTEHVLNTLPDVVITTGHPRRVYHCDGYNNLDQHGTPLDLPTIIDISSHWAAKVAALEAHSSQPIPDHFGPMAEALGRLHGRRIGTLYAEGFRTMPVLGRLLAAQGL